MGCGSSVPVENGKKQATSSGASTTAKQLPSTNAHSTAPAASGPQQQVAAARAGAGSPTNTKVTALVTPRNEEEELNELDRLLQATKSELQTRPLELSGSPSPTKLLTSGTGSLGQSEHQAQLRPASITPIAGHSSGSGPDGPGTPPQEPSTNASLMTTKQPSLLPLRQPGMPGAPSPGPTSPAGVMPASQPAAPDDPWASLQSAYRIDATKQAGSTAGGPQGMGSPTAVRPAEVPPAANGNSSKAPRGVLQRGGAAVGGGSDILVLEDDEDEPMGAKAVSQPLYSRQPVLAPHMSTKPKNGGWGNGAMAQAGTLMVGDTDQEMARLAPPGSVSPPQAPPSPMLDANEFEKIKQRIKANEAVADLGVEDIEDVDELIEQEAKRGGLSTGLAAKLAAFEALND